MKKLILMVAVVMISSLTFAQRVQENDVPVVVKTTIKERYPNAKNANWEREREHYKVNFKDRDQEHTVKIHSSGRIVETMMETDENAIPTNMKNYVANNYSNHKIRKAKKYTDANGHVTYETHVNGRDLVFDNNGNFLREKRK